MAKLLKTHAQIIFSAQNKKIVFQIGPKTPPEEPESPKQIEQTREQGSDGELTGDDMVWNLLLKIFNKYHSNLQEPIPIIEPKLNKESKREKR